MTMLLVFCEPGPHSESIFSNELCCMAHCPSGPAPWPTARRRCRASGGYGHRQHCEHDGRLYCAQSRAAGAPHLPAGTARHPDASMESSVASSASKARLPVERGRTHRRARRPSRPILPGPDLLPLRGDLDAWGARPRAGEARPPRRPSGRQTARGALRSRRPRQAPASGRSRPTCVRRTSTRARATPGGEPARRAKPGGHVSRNAGASASSSQMKTPCMSTRPPPRAA